MPGFKKLESFEFHHELEMQAGTSLVMFTGESCGSCRAWKQLLISYQKQHAITLYEIDAGKDMALVNEFDVFHLPAMFLYAQGRYHSPLQCEAKLPVLEQAIHDCLQADAREMP